MHNVINVIVLTVIVHLECLMLCLHEPVVTCLNSQDVEASFATAILQ